MKFVVKLIELILVGEVKILEFVFHLEYGNCSEVKY